MLLKQAENRQAYSPSHHIRTNIDGFNHTVFSVKHTESNNHIVFYSYVELFAMDGLLIVLGRARDGPRFDLLRYKCWVGIALTALVWTRAIAKQSF